MHLGSHAVFNIKFNNFWGTTYIPYTVLIDILVFFRLHRLAISNQTCSFIPLHFWTTFDLVVIFTFDLILPNHPQYIQIKLLSRYVLWQGNSPKMDFWPYVAWLWPWSLTSKSNRLIFVYRCTNAVTVRAIPHLALPPAENWSFLQIWLWPKCSRISIFWPYLQNHA